MKNNLSLRVSLLAGTALLSVGLSHSVQAAGFFIQEQSVSAGGSAYAGAVSNTKDASTIFFNPAGMTQLDGAQVNLGVQLLLPSSELENTGSTNTIFPGGLPLVSVPTTGGDGGNPYEPTPVPSFYAAMPVPMVNGLWAGIGVSAPFGLANKYDEDYFGRFDSIETELKVYDIQPSLAYKINDRVSVGGALNVQYAEAKLTGAVSNAVSEGTSKLEGDDWGYGYTLGAQFKIMPETTLGLNYRSSVHHDLEGEVTVEGLTPVLPFFPAPNGVTPASASLVTPDIASIGLSHRLNDKWTIMGQANWFGWNEFNDITAISDAGGVITSVDQNYQTVWSYAVGAEYEYSPEWTFRGGIQFDNTPTTDEYRTTRTPDGDRTWFATGATYTLNDRFSLDMNATYIHIASEEINVVRGTAAVPATVSADTSGSVGIVGLALNYKF